MWKRVNNINEYGGVYLNVLYSITSCTVHVQKFDIHGSTRKLHFQYCCLCMNLFSMEIIQYCSFKQSIDILTLCHGKTE